MYVLAIGTLAGRGDGHQPLEVAGEVALVDKAGGRCNFGDGASFQQQRFGARDAYLGLESVRPGPRGLPEDAVEVKRAQADQGRKLLQGECAIVVGADVVLQRGDNPRLSVDRLFSSFILAAALQQQR